MIVSDFVASFLAERGVTHAFEVSGGMITHLLDAIHRAGKTQLVSVHHEQAAAFAAEGHARMTGIPGVALATSGPGATNLLTGIASCYFDSVPAVFITGQVNRHERKGDREIRQLGFQETDIVAMAKPITKLSWTVEEATDVPAALDLAFRVALDGRPGPVLLDLPMDIQRMNVSSASIATMCLDAKTDTDHEFVTEFLAALTEAKRPILLAGGGIRSARCIDAFRAATRVLGIPIVTSLMGVDAVSFDDQLRVGMIGSYGNRWANLAIGNSDLVLVVGSRLDVRQTGADVAGFKEGRVIFHVDVTPAEMNNRVTGCRTTVADLRDFFPDLIEAANNSSLPTFDDWRETIAAMREEWPDDRELSVEGINPNTFMHQLSAASNAAAAHVVDVGQHQMWAAQSLRLAPHQRFLTSGGMGSMGFALPAAIGAAMGTAQPISVIAGDGGFQCNIQELQTVVRNRLPIKIIVIDNGCHGMVRQFQESYFEGRYQSTLWGYSAPDFARVANAYGIPSRDINDPAAVDDAVAWLWGDPTTPALLTVRVDPMANALPKIAFGHPITSMEPFVKPIEMEST